MLAKRICERTQADMRSSAIAQINRGRSSQSLDVHGPQDGGRDDGTVGGIVRRRFDGAKQAYPKSIQI